MNNGQVKERLIFPISIACAMNMVHAVSSSPAFAVFLSSGHTRRKVLQLVTNWSAK